MREQVQEIMQKVGLLPTMLDRYPHEFSGGQRQRIEHCPCLGAQARNCVICRQTSVGLGCVDSGAGG